MTQLVLLVLRSRRRWRRGRASRERLQTVALAACWSSNRRVFLGHLHSAVRPLEGLRIFLLLIESQCQAKNVYRSRVGRVCVDGLLKIVLRGNVILFFVLNRADNRVGLRTHLRLVGVHLILWRVCWYADVRVDGLQAFL